MAMSAKRRGVDTISDLPCNILDGILGCLPLKDAVKTSILSREWRYKWVTRQELVFGYSFLRSLAREREARTIIYQVLLLHKGPILKFGVGISRSIRFSDIDHWILFLTKKNVQEFTLYGNYDNRYHLPSHLFRFHHLRHLEVDSCFFHPPPDFKGFEKLVDLHLVKVTFVPAILRNLISRCPLLERLSLRWCTDFDTFEIDAANLKCFQFRGTSNSICFNNTPMLKKATVCLDSPVSMDASPPVCPNLTKFFGYMPCLMELDIDGYLLEYLKMGGLPENHVTALNNVKCLTIRRVLFRDIEEVSCIIYLLTCCPKLRELTIESGMIHIVAEPVVHYLRDKSRLYGVVKLLQSVHMSMFNGLEMEMEFLRLILASAPVLEKISIWNYEPLICRTGSQILDEMKQVQHASPNVEFIIDEVEVESSYHDFEHEEIMEVPYEFDQ